MKLKRLMPRQQRGAVCFFGSFGSYKGDHTTLGYSGRYFCRKNIVGINMKQSVQMVWDTVMAFHGLPVKSKKNRRKRPGLFEFQNQRVILLL